jgi:hypothetical protein
MAGEIVHHDDIAMPQVGDHELFDISAKAPLTLGDSVS